MPKITPDYKIAVGNNNVGALTAIDALVSDGVYFVMPEGLRTRTRGLKRKKLNGVTARIGFNSVQWISSVMTIPQLKQVYDTYELGGTGGGLVTVRLALTSTTFANYNAALEMPDERDLDWFANITSILENVPTSGVFGGGYGNVIWTFTNLEAL